MSGEFLTDTKVEDNFPIVLAFCSLRGRLRRPERSFFFKKEYVQLKYDLYLPAF